MKTSSWIAAGLALGVVAWFASGLFVDGEEGEPRDEAGGSRQPILVETRVSMAREVPDYIYAQGVAKPFRSAEVIAQTGGAISDVEVQQGDLVDAGAELARVRLDARESELASAAARVKAAEADLRGARELRQKGFTTPSRIRELEAELNAAQAALEDIRERIEDTRIIAPIPGIVGSVFVNRGQAAPAGSKIASIVDNAPLRVMLNISQRSVGKLRVGDTAVVSFATGALATGRVCFIAPAADPETRTFRVEIRVLNEKREIPSVISAEVRVRTGKTKAHFVSPAILSLSEAGALGVKIIDGKDKVEFRAVDVMRSGADGFWVTGLPDQVRLISVGQGFVRDGEAVRTQSVNEEQRTEQRNPVAAGAARLPTSSPQSADFSEAGDLPDPPPVEMLCRKTGANAQAPQAAPAAEEGSQPMPSDQSGAVGEGDGSAGEISGGGQGAGQAPASPSTVTSPQIPLPPADPSGGGGSASPPTPPGRGGNDSGLGQATGQGQGQ